MSVPTTKVLATATEYTVTDLLQPDTATAISSDWLRHFRTHTDSANADGWIDIRPFIRMTIIATAGAQAGDYNVEVKAGSNDPRTTSIGSSTALAPAATAELYIGECEHYSHVRVLHNKNGGTAGTSTISLLLK